MYVSWSDANVCTVRWMNGRLRCMADYFMPCIGWVGLLHFQVHRKNLDWKPQPCQVRDQLEPKLLNFENNIEWQYCSLENFLLDPGLEDSNLSLILTAHVWLKNTNATVFWQRSTISIYFNFVYSHTPDLIAYFISCNIAMYCYVRIWVL
jgi:hypothetical protein